MTQLNTTPQTFSETHYKDLAKLSISDTLTVIRASKEYEWAGRQLELDRLFKAANPRKF